MLRTSSSVPLTLLGLKQTSGEWQKAIEHSRLLGFFLIAIVPLEYLLEEE